MKVEALSDLGKSGQGIARPISGTNLWADDGKDHLEVLGRTYFR